MRAAHAGESRVGRLSAEPSLGLGLASAIRAGRKLVAKAAGEN
jgi:hypothetical protein